MFGTWRRSPWFIQMPLLDTPGDGGGGGGDLSGADADAHPEYDVDFGDPPDDDPPVQGDPGATPPSRTVQPPAQGDPGAGPDPRTQAPTREQYDQLVTGYRSMERNFTTLQAQNQLLQRQVAALTGQQPPAQPQGDQPQLTEADQKAIKAVYRLFPQLKPLLEKAQDILQLPEQVSSFKSEADSRWTDIGTRMWDSFDKAITQAYGLQNGAKLTPFAQKSIDSAFIAWLETDRNAAARYRMGDMTLPAEFMQMYRSGVIVPAQRATAGGTPNQQRGALGRPGQQQQPPRVPRGGPGSTTVGQRPQQPNTKKPDQVHDAAADAFFAQRG